MKPATGKAPRAMKTMLTARFTAVTAISIHLKAAALRLRCGRNTASMNSWPSMGGASGERSQRGVMAAKVRPLLRAPKGNAHVARRLTKAKAEQLYARLAQDRPDPRTELEYINPYTLLVAVVLSAQATDKGVNRAAAPLFKIADTPAKMLKLGEAGVAERIKTIGLWRNKARNVIALSRALIEQHGGEV